MEQVRIAGVSMEVDATNESYFHQRFSAYACSLDEPPAVRVISRVVDCIDLPAGEEICNVRGGKILRLPDGRMCRYEVAPENGQLTFLARYTPDFSQVEMEVCPVRFAWAQEYEYMYVGTAFANQLEMLGGSTLHGSAISYRGEGVIFSAPSGTGKSTHTALWKQCFKDDVVFVNDDRPAIRVVDGVPMMYGTPWSGKTALNNPLAVPLKAIVFLERGNENSVSRLGFTESMLLLGGQMAKPYYDAALGGKVVDLMATLAQTVPIYRLICNMDPAAAYASKDAIFGE